MQFRSIFSSAILVAIVATTIPQSTTARRSKARLVRNHTLKESFVSLLFSFNIQSLIHSFLLFPFGIILLYLVATGTQRRRFGR